MGSRLSNQTAGSVGEPKSLAVDLSLPQGVQKFVAQRCQEGEVRLSEHTCVKRFTQMCGGGVVTSCVHCDVMCIIRY